MLIFTVGVVIVLRCRLIVVDVASGVMVKLVECALVGKALADYVGVTREAVSKTLSEWRQSGIVEVSRGRIVVRDVQALQALADFEAE